MAESANPIGDFLESIFGAKVGGEDVTSPVIGGPTGTPVVTTELPGSEDYSHFEKDREGNRLPNPRTVVNSSTSAQLQVTPPPPQAGSDYRGIITDDAVMQATLRAVKASEAMTRLGTPVYEEPDLGTYHESLDIFRKQNTGFQTELDSALALEKQSYADKRNSLLSRGQAEIEQDQAAQARAQQVADMAAAVNSFYGVDGNASRISEKVIAANNLRNDIEERGKTGFTDDPLAWIENLFVTAHERDQLGDLEKDITYNNARAKDAYELRSLAIPSITAQQSLAKAKFDAAQTQSDVADASTAYAKVNTQHAATTFAHAVSTVATEGEAASREMALAKEKYTVQLQAILNADTAAKYSFQVVKLMEDVQERQELVGKSLRLAEANLALPQGTLSYNIYKALSTDDKAYYMGAAVGRLGATPGQAVAATTRVGGHNLPVIGPDAPTINKALLQLNQKWRDDALADPGIKLYNTPEGRDGFVAEFINKKWKYAEDNPESNPAENPFSAISPQALDKATGGTLSQSPVGKILQPYISSGATLTAEQVISDIHKTAISQDIDPYTESKMIFDYYTANVRARNQGIPFQLYGVDPKPQYIYMTKGTPYLTFTGGLGINPLNEPGRRVNLLNFDDIRRMTIHTHNAETIQRGEEERSFQQQKSGIY